MIQEIASATDEQSVTAKEISTQAHLCEMDGLFEEQGKVFG